MYSKKDVVLQLRKAASEIQSLTNDNIDLKANNEELLQKIASFESTVNIAAEEEEYNNATQEESALQKQAEYTFDGRGSGFGSTSDDIPIFDSELSAEQRLDMILSGESLSDFS